MIVIIFYRILLVILFPFIILLMLYRIIIGKEDKKRFFERFGITKIKRPDGKLIWFNAVSIGEINSAWRIIRNINEKYDFNILITTTTLTSSQIVLEKIEKLKNKKKVIHQFAPIDLTTVVYFFIKKWKPNILINIESEFWPNLFSITSKNCPIIVLNGKMSKKSFRFWYKFKKLKEVVFPKIDVCLAQSKSDYKRFLILGVQSVKFLGNIKCFVEKSDVDEELYSRLFKITSNRHIWLVNCSHEGEEEIIVKTHKILKEKYKDLITFLIIRHPDRLNDVKSILSRNNISYTTTTQNNPINNDIEFYVHDKLGNLGTFFRLCRIVFMCGSLKKGIGGHNPSEAIKFDCCVLTGPYIDNNYVLFKELQENNACIILKEDNEIILSKKIQYLFDNPEEVKILSNNAYIKSLEYSKNSNEIMDLIYKIIA